MQYLLNISYTGRPKTVHQTRMKTFIGQFHRQMFGTAMEVEAFVEYVRKFEELSLASSHWNDRLNGHYLPPRGDSKDYYLSYPDLAILHFMASKHGRSQDWRKFKRSLKQKNDGKFKANESQSEPSRGHTGENQRPHRGRESRV